jgi:hypothetical protein
VTLLVPISGTISMQHLVGYCRDGRQWNDWCAAIQLTGPNPGENDSNGRGEGMAKEGKSGFSSFVKKAVVIAVVAFVAAKLVDRLHPDLLPRLKERMMRCCCGAEEGMKACMERCGCGKVAEPEPEPEPEPEAEAAPAAEPAPVD